MGRKEFHRWADRIISGALVSAEVESQKFALANMLLHLGPTESHKPDAFFIHSLRKFAINQVADEIRKELHETAKAKEAEKKAEEDAKKTPEQREAEKQAEATIHRIQAKKAT